MAAPATDPIIEEMERIYAEYSGKMRELHERQKELMARMIQRLDTESAEKARKTIENHDQEI